MEGTAEACSEWPADAIDGGGVNVSPGGAPASMREKTERHEACTDSGSSTHAWYMSST